MDTTRTSVSHMGLEDAQTADNSPEANMAKAIRLLAKNIYSCCCQFQN